MTAHLGGAVEYAVCNSVEGYDAINGYIGYDTKHSDSNPPIKLKRWGMQSTTSYLSLPGLLWLEMVTPDSSNRIVLHLN